GLPSNQIIGETRSFTTMMSGTWVRPNEAAADRTSLRIEDGAGRPRFTTDRNWRARWKRIVSSTTIPLSQNARGRAGRRPAASRMAVKPSAQGRMLADANATIESNDPEIHSPRLADSSE